MAINKKNMYFLLFGIGIGMLATSILNMIYPDVKHIQYTDEQIKHRATELGMVSLKDVISENGKEKEIITKENTDNNTVDSNEDKQKQESEVVSFIIKKGDTSEEIVERLFEQGIIKDKDKIMDIIIQKDAQRRFNYGKYDIKKGIEYEALIDILTKNQ